jgi:hypothetical protein
MRLDTLGQDLTGLGKATNLTLIFGYINANILHGWSSLCAALTTFLLVDLYALTSG